MTQSGFKISTFGCKVNTYDSGLLQKRLHQAGFVSDPENPSIHVLNSCAVTAEATKEALREARRIKARNPLATVVLTGCAAQVDGGLIDEAPGIDLVIANSHKQDLEELLKKHFRGELTQKVFRSNIFRKEDLEAGGGEEESHTRSYLKIQDGCNSFCSFCIIPFARGKSRSLPVPQLIAKVNQLKEQGVNEVVLTGVHIGDYCDEQSAGGPFYLDDLVEQVLVKTKIPRIRLTSLEPVELTEKLMDLFNDPRLCPHFHMSVQSLSTAVLKGMRRNYDATKVVESLEWIADRYPEAFVGMDVIVGFPGETDDLFLETLENLKATPWTRIHVFPYSERKGTRAEVLTDSVPMPARKLRARLLRELSQERYSLAAKAQKGKIKQVLMLRSSQQDYRALSKDYWDVRVSSSYGELHPGRLYQVEISGFHIGEPGQMNGFLQGELR